MKGGGWQREKGIYQQGGQLCEVGDLISSRLEILHDPCNFTAS